MPSLSLTSKGQVTVPVKIRRSLGLNPGDRVKFVEQKGKYFIERDNDDISSIFGMFKAKKSASLEQMETAISAGWRRRARR